MGFGRKNFFATSCFFIILFSNGYTLEPARENLLVFPDDGDDDSTSIAFRYIKYLSRNEDEQVDEHLEEDDEDSHMHQLDSGSGFDKEEIIEIEINNNNNEDELILLENKPAKKIDKEDSIETEVEIISESKEEEIEITSEWNGVGKGMGTDKNIAVDRRNEDPKSHKKKKSK